MRCPALLISAPASGQGKTTVTAALARLLARRGMRVQVFKNGPDFVDPGWHALASGRPVHNLDLWMTGERDIRARLHQAAQTADIILIEGMAGLHDGTPSNADLARLLGIPVLVVMQAGAMAHTLAAVVQGLRDFGSQAQDPLPWAGVLANGVASVGHADLLRGALRSDDGWLGHLPTSDALHVPERQLGLTAAGDLPGVDGLARLDAAADLLQDTPLGQMGPGDWAARWGVDFQAPEAAATPCPPLLDGLRIALAHDAAFRFVYAANLDLLQQLGAHLLVFSPLAGEALPDCDALWLPGGHPELHAARLAQRTGLTAQIQAHAAAGRPIWAEGGGMMVLTEALVDAQGQEHPMWSLLPGRAVMQTRLAGLGLQQWQPQADMPVLRGHAFHYGRVEGLGVPSAHTEMAPGSLRAEGEAIWRQGPLRASWFHPWFASAPEAAALLFQ